MEFFFCLESINDTNTPPNIKLNELIVHAEICVDMVKENNEFYAEVIFFFTFLFYFFFHQQNLKFKFHSI